MGQETEISENFRMPDTMWEQIQPLLPPEPENRKEDVRGMTTAR